MKVWGSSGFGGAAPQGLIPGALCNMWTEKLSRSFQGVFEGCVSASTPQLSFKIPQIPSNRDHKALNRATLGV